MQTAPEGQKTLAGAGWGERAKPRPARRNSTAGPTPPLLSLPNGTGGRRLFTGAPARSRTSLDPGGV